MRYLLAIIILAALAWSGYWYWSATTREQALAQWLEERRADGWVAEAADISVTGFPNRIDVVVTGLELADPDAGWAWSAPEFQILSLSYKPNHIIAAWPGEQTIGTPFETIRIVSETLRGSVVFVPGFALILDRTTLEAENLSATSNLGWTSNLETALVSLRRTPDADAPPYFHDLNILFEGFTPPEGTTGNLDTSGILPAAMQTANLNSTIAFNRPLDRVSVESDNPEIERIEIKELSATWGKLDLRGRGEIEADREGYAEGEIKLRARNWRDMFDFAEQSGAIPGSIAGALRAGLDLLATFSGGGDSLTVPLTFEDGDTMLGPVAIGNAPRLRRE